jgi:ferredoxin
MQASLSERSDNRGVGRIRLTVDGRDVAVPEGTTLLGAAEALGIHIPNLCYMEGCEAFTSCMLCVVHDLKAGRLIPSCSIPVSEGMAIQTDDELVRTARKDTLDLLLSEHVGDCEAPCQRGCPAHMDIPLMICQIQSQRLEEAIATVKRDIALPATLGRICAAPCENVCHRKSHDQAVSVCLLKRFAADADLEKEVPYTPQLQKASGKQVAIVGGGPTGLAAAYYLLQKGHAVHIYDPHPLLGGLLRYGVSDEKLPKAVLDAEIAQIQALGLEFHPGVALGKEVAFESLQRTHDAVILALGTIDPDSLGIPGLDLTSRGIAIQQATYETSLASVFAGGNAISESRRAIRALAHGKEIAFSVDQFLSGLPVVGEPVRFSSRMGKMLEGEAAGLLQIDGAGGRISPEGGDEWGFDSAESIGESSRCLRCDCRDIEECKLRQYADEYQADQTRFKMGERKKVQKVFQHGGRVLYEPGKCIKCGLCVQIAQREGEELGLSFVGRGFDVRVAVPFDGSFDEGLKKAARACIEACPTSALIWCEEV